MKRYLFPIVLALLSSCEGMIGEMSKGELRIMFDGNIAEETRSLLPDTDDFILSVVNSSGASIYEGPFRESPGTMELSTGKYTVSARSCDFTVPAFDSPQYGDSQTVTVSAGTTTVVKLGCVQTNCGIRIHPDYSFLSEFPKGELYLKSSSGTLLYSYEEKRYAFFNPGQISLVLSDGNEVRTLLSRQMVSQQMLQINLSAVPSSSTGGKTGSMISIQMDTTRNWMSESYTVGGEGSEWTDAYSISEALNHIGEDDVWVCGYIVGGDLSSSKCSFTPPFTSNTNIVLAERSSCTDKASCFSVQLSKGDVRDELNLVDNPDNYGRKVYLKGLIVEKYYGIPGIQAITEYRFK